MCCDAMYCVYIYIAKLRKFFRGLGKISTLSAHLVFFKHIYPLSFISIHNIMFEANAIYRRLNLKQNLK